MEFRIEQVHNRLRCNRKEAIAYIEKVDEDRRKWTKFLLWPGLGRMLRCTTLCLTWNK